MSRHAKAKPMSDVIKPGQIVVNAELACTHMVKDPVLVMPRKVEAHAYRTGCVTIEIHDPLAEGIKGSLLLHFDAHELMRMITTALMTSDA